MRHFLYYSARFSPKNAAVIVGMAIVAPYFVNFTNDISTFCFFKRPIHIIPARAPIGVKNAPIFEPMIDA